MQNEVKNSEYIYKGKVINVRIDDVEREDGSVFKKEVVEYPQSVVIIALTDDDYLIMEKQYRHATGETLYELPAGKVDENESPEVTAVRELEEETGYRASGVTRLFSGYTTPGMCTEYMHFYLAAGLEKGTANMEEDEQIEIELVPLEKAREMIKDGIIRDNKTALGILLVS
ncbi:NUDIX hydrolase [Candidatus Margulisiibacteriota bacterium]